MKSAKESGHKHVDIEVDHVILGVSKRITDILSDPLYFPSFVNEVYVNAAIFGMEDVDIGFVI